MDGPTTASPPPRPPALAVIGTSWGGLLAVADLLDRLPAALACPIALVQHRGAHPSELAKLLARHTDWPVREADDKDTLDPGTLYVAPADYHLLVDRTGFALSTEAPVRFSRPSIDVLFHSAADAFGSRLVGVLLTGANEDGAAGLAHIQERGGYTLVQDPDTAARADMPQAALSRMTPDVVGSLAVLADHLTARCGLLGEREGPAPDPATSGQWDVPDKVRREGESDMTSRRSR